MKLDDILTSLFPGGHEVTHNHGLLSGQGRISPSQAMVVIGVESRTALGIDEALHLSYSVLEVLKTNGTDPILVLVDSDSQRMSKRDELLGLNEFLAHLAKCLILADRLGHRTVGLLYGHTAAGAFIATALATRLLAALPGAEPVVMDLPSMSRVTKLPLDVLTEKAKSTPVFAPGLDNLAKTGAITTVFDPATSLAAQMTALLARPIEPRDSRDRLGRERGGRTKAAEIAQRVYGLAYGRH
jgi:malonate decarboxylase gamma subunit